MHAMFGIVAGGAIEQQRFARRLIMPRGRIGGDERLPRARGVRRKNRLWMTSQLELRG